MYLISGDVNALYDYEHRTWPEWRLKSERDYTERERANTVY